MHKNLNNTFSQMLSQLRAEKAEFNKSIDARIAALETAAAVFTGEVKPTPKTAAHKVTRVSGRRGMKIDRKAGQKTYAFLLERGEKLTTVKMVARKFGITNEAASQRMLNLYNEGKAVRASKGNYISDVAAKSLTTSTSTAEA